MANERFTIEDVEKWDEKAFHLLYNHYYKALVYYASRIMNNMAAAEDIVQDLFSRMYEEKLHFARVSHLNAYLYNCIRNATVDYLRHRNIEANYVSKTLQELSYILTDDGDDDFFREEFYHELFCLIDAMPKRQREVFLLYMKGKKNKEISDALNVSLETVKTQKKRAMKMLRSQMSHELLTVLLLMIKVQ